MDWAVWALITNYRGWCCSGRFLSHHRRSMIQRRQSRPRMTANCIWVGQHCRAAQTHRWREFGRIDVQLRPLTMLHGTEWNQTHTHTKHGLAETSNRIGTFPKCIWTSLSLTDGSSFSFDCRLDWTTHPNDLWWPEGVHSALCVLDTNKWRFHVDLSIDLSGRDSTWYEPQQKIQKKILESSYKSQWTNDTWWKAYTVIGWKITQIP